MPGNSFGELFRVTTAGVSHGPGYLVIIDGCPPGLPLSADDLLPDLRRRRPGQSKLVTQRDEEDVPEIWSGVFEGQTDGTSIGILFRNTDQRSRDYSDIKDKYRPGHADYTFDAKYGLRDYRGGGRSSARETAARVAAGAVARKIVPGMTVRGALVAMGPHHIDRARWDWEEVSRNPFFCPDAAMATFFETYLDGIRRQGSSIGAVIEVVAEGLPAGLGAPVSG